MIRLTHLHSMGIIAVLNASLAASVFANDSEVLKNKWSGNSYHDCTTNGVEIGENGELVYARDSKGNRLPDYSQVGYHAGEKAIPDAVVVETIEPVDGDNTAHIQAAIDRIGAKPVGKDGLRGALLLKRGIYSVAGAIHIRHSGVVLRGEGRGTNGTILVAAGYEDAKDVRAIISSKDPQTLISIGDNEGVVLKEESKQPIVDDYVPVGTRSFSVASAASYKVGDRIILHRPFPMNWIKYIGMDNLELRYRLVDGKKVLRTKQWIPEDFIYHFERKITAIDENRITIDVPVMHTMETRFGGGAIYHYDTPGRVFEVGIEDMTLLSEFGEPTATNPYGDVERDKLNEDHCWIAISANRNSENIWVRRVSGNYFARALVNLVGSRATAEDCVNLGHVSVITGSRRYPFVTNGQMNLFQRCVAFRGRHEFVTTRSTAGPNVFVDCLGINCVAQHGSGPHGRYSIGVLFDNIKSDSMMESADYGARGGGHGWGGAQTTFYNCDAPNFWVRAPLGQYCWVIGKQKKDDPNSQMAEPRSLYLAQLKERLGDEAYERMTIKAQRNGTIYGFLLNQFFNQMRLHQLPIPN